MKTLDELPDLITPNELCEVTPQLDVQAVRRACREGTMPATKVGRKWLIIKPLLMQGRKEEEVA